MAVSSTKIDPPALDLDDGKTGEFALGDHSADQETATDQPPHPPSSGKASPTATGTY